MHIDLLDAMPAGFVRFMDNNFIYELTQERRGQFSGDGVFPHDFQKL